MGGECDWVTVSAPPLYSTARQEVGHLAATLCEPLATQSTQKAQYGDSDEVDNRREAPQVAPIAVHFPVSVDEGADVRGTRGILVLRVVHTQTTLPVFLGL